MRKIFILFVFAFFIKSAFSQECKVDTLDSCYRFILEVPVELDSLGYDKLFRLCDSLKISVTCPEDQPARPIDYFWYFKIPLSDDYFLSDLIFSPVCRVRVKD